jgi:cyclopropane-fatty-acyl-phospholipid synthase
MIVVPSKPTALSPSRPPLNIRIVHQQFTDILSQWASRYFMSALGRMKFGKLEVKSSFDGRVQVLGEPEYPPVSLTVKKQSMWLRVMLGSSIVSRSISASVTQNTSNAVASKGFAESYMLGEVDCPDLVSLLTVSIRLDTTPFAARY